MLSPKARTGLLAFALVGGAFVVVGGVGALVVVNRDRVTEPGSSHKGRLADQPLSQGMDGDDEAYILGHRWWKKPPTKVRLDELVKYTIESNADYAVWVDDRCEFIRSKEWHLSPLSSRYVRTMPDNITTKRHFYMVFSEDKRPDRSSVLQSVRSELDRCEFRDGPGR